MENQNADYEAKFQRFSQIISTKTMEGYTVIDRNDKGLVAVLGKAGGKVNHVLHLIIGLCTCGAWWLVWIVLALMKPAEQRIRISLDSAGNISEEKIKI